MPRKYKRKQNVSPRASWSEEDLQRAIESVKSKTLGVNAASRQFKIPSRTLRRRIELNNSKKVALGKPCALGEQNEKRLVNHIKKLQGAGFAPTAKTVRTMAYSFGKKLKVENKFSVRGEVTGSAGMHWFYSFMERHKELSIRKSEGLSLARAKGMNREEVNEFYNLLRKTLEKYDLISKPRSIYNMDESGIQINNMPEKVVAERGSKCVHVVTSKERGENVSIIACANAEGTFLPPVLILKGVRKNVSALEGMPAGSDIYMNKKSSFITAELFLKWLKEIFVPRKPDGPVILILDGHSSHCSIEMLEYAEQNNVHLLCLPSHTTQALQPLDRSFFKPLKDWFKREAETFMFRSKEKNISRNIIGKLIGSAWAKAATITNATSGFSATGIYPYNEHIVPDYFFQVADSNQNINKSENNGKQAEGNERDKANNFENANDREQADENVVNDVDNYLFVLDDTLYRDANVEIIIQDDNISLEEEMRLAEEILMDTAATGDKGTDEAETTKENEVVNMLVRSNEDSNNVEEIAETPSKILRDIAPVPTVPMNKSKKKQSAELLSSSTLKLKANEKGKKTKDRKLKGTVKRKKTQNEGSTQNVSKIKKRAIKTKKSENVRVTKTKKSDDADCAECLESYYSTEERVDWIKCTDCHKWLHETCTMYGSRCNDCGKTAKRLERSQACNKQINF